MQIYAVWPRWYFVLTLSLHMSHKYGNKYSCVCIEYCLYFPMIFLCPIAICSVQHCQAMLERGVYVSLLTLSVIRCTCIVLLISLLKSCIYFLMHANWKKILEPSHAKKKKELNSSSHADMRIFCNICFAIQECSYNTQLF